jgi:diaminohydroxyphosphoribosylaminopyrimidine deaminase/5-amino-6-(5-phosphoribosylamino)uracil reductase
MVGALIVEDEQVVAIGYHAKAGEAHAEVVALKSLGRKPKSGAVLYVTLEPCCTHGRTPPCVDAIIASGIKKVVVGAVDPNPAHAGKGLDLLRQSGIEVISGVLADEAKDLNLIFNHWIAQQRPLIALKLASTSDYRLVHAEKTIRSISCALSQADVHHWRKLFPAIAVSVDTLLADNPHLTARLPHSESCSTRFILDRRFRSVQKLNLNLFQDKYHQQTVVVGLKKLATPDILKAYESAGVSVWVIDGDENSFLGNWIQKCAAEKIVGVYVESGPRLASVMIEKRIADYFFLYFAKTQNGDPESLPWTKSGVPPLREKVEATFEKDTLTRGFLIK